MTRIRFRMIISMEEYMKKLLVVMVTLGLALSMVFAADYATLEGEVASISKYGNAETDIKADEVAAAGYEPGDLVSLSAAGFSGIVPLGTNYSDVDSGETIVVVSDEGVSIAINYGSFETASGVVVGSPVTIDMAEKGGYLDEYAIRQLVRTDAREDYGTDEIFANFRMVDEGNIVPGVLYRSCSPVRGDSRTPYADALAEAAGIRTVINLADSEESMAEGLAMAPYYSSLVEDGSVITLDMAVDFFTPDFTTKLAEGLRFMISHEAPYLIHCNEGKDRAGMVTALIEALCGATMDEIIADYMESYENYYGVEKGTEQYDMIASIITDFFTTMNGRAFPWNAVGTVAENYAKNTIGLTDDEISSLRTILTEN